MKNCICLLIIVIFLAFPYKSNANTKNLPNYWAGFHFGIYNYNMFSRDCQRLGLFHFEPDNEFTGDKKTSKLYIEIQNEAKKIFEKYIVRDMKFHNVAEKFFDAQMQYVHYTKGVPASIARRNEGQAILEANLKAEYGENAGMVWCNISIKRHTFPILYQIQVSYSIDGTLQASNIYSRDIEYSTVENLKREILRKVEAVLRECGKYIWGKDVR